MKSKREASRYKRHRRILMRMSGDAVRPRLVVRRSLKHMHAQLVDDTAHAVLLSGTTAEKEMRGQPLKCGSVKQAEALGTFLAKRALEKGISTIVFDRAGYLYHGRIKAFADALRKGGVTF